jgi:hypothetical protein
LVIITLSGDDLALAGGGVSRYVTVEGTYDGTAGLDMPVVEEVSFDIENLKGQPNT